MAAFRLAAQMGVDEVELDVQRATDGVAVLCHDKVLDRYGYRGQLVEEMASEQLLSLDYGSWFSPHFFAGEPMTTLKALFAEYGDRFTYHVEIKGRARELPRMVHDLIVQRRLVESCIVSSFSYDHLDALRAIDPVVRRAWLIHEVGPDTITAAEALDLFALCPKAAEVSAETVRWGRQVAREVRAWGLGGSSVEVVGLIHRVVDAGCDGMTINWPDWVCHR